MKKEFLNVPGKKRVVISKAKGARKIKVTAGNGSSLLAYDSANRLTLNGIIVEHKNGTITVKEQMGGRKVLGTKPLQDVLNKEWVVIE